MRGVEQVRAELEGRVGLGLEHAVGVKAVFADKAVVDADGEEWKLVEAAAAKLGIEAEITPGLPGLIGSHFFPIKHKTDQSKTLPFAYLLVLDYADCTLKHTIDHEHIAGEDFHRIRYIANNLGQALDNVTPTGAFMQTSSPTTRLSSATTGSSSISTFSASDRSPLAARRQVLATAHLKWPRSCLPPPTKPRAR
jgi:hypothetical protein